MARSLARLSYVVFVGDETPLRASKDHFSRLFFAPEENKTPMLPSQARALLAYVSQVQVHSSSDSITTPS
jgi:hypothetical protein